MLMLFFTINLFTFILLDIACEFSWHFSYKPLTEPLSFLLFFLLFPHVCFGTNLSRFRYTRF